MADNGQWGKWYVAVQELVDEDSTAWPVTLSMSSYGVAKRMFILEKIGKKAVSQHAVCGRDKHFKIPLSLILGCQNQCSAPCSCLKAYHSSCVFPTPLCNPLSVPLPPPPVSSVYSPNLHSDWQCGVLGGLQGFHICTLCTVRMRRLPVTVAQIKRGGVLLHTHCCRTPHDAVLSPQALYCQPPVRRGTTPWGVKYRSAIPAKGTHCLEAVSGKFVIDSPQLGFVATFKTPQDLSPPPHNPLFALSPQAPSPSLACACHVHLPT